MAGPPADESPVAQPGPATAAFRRRVELAAGLMQSACAQLLDPSGVPDGPGRGAYLAVLSNVFEVLLGLSGTVPLEDLVKLSRIVAEQRRAEAAVRRPPRPGTRTPQSGADAPPPFPADPAASAISEPTTDIRLPATFPAIVRAIYGLNLDAAAQPPAPRPNAPPPDPPV